MFNVVSLDKGRAAEPFIEPQGGASTASAMGYKSPRAVQPIVTSSATTSCSDASAKSVHNCVPVQAMRGDNKPQFGSSQRMFTSAPMFGSQRCFGEVGNSIAVGAHRR